MSSFSFKKIVLTSVISTFMIAVYLTGSSLAAGTEKDANAVQLLESVRQNYYAHERLASLRHNKTLSIKKEVPANMWLRKVKAGEVNMVTNRYTGVQQDAVHAGDKTYFATGRGYALNLKQNKSVRFANDPISGKTIDKAEAATYADASGRVLYFESDKTFERFVGLADSDTLYGYSK